MKSIVAGVGVWLLACATAWAGEGWPTDFEGAKKQAKEQNRVILADFSGSDWCGWCMTLEKEVFSQQEFKDFARDNLVLLQVDFPFRKPQPAELKKANQALRDRYRIVGYPTVLLLDAEGKELARTGYQPGGAKAYIEHLKVHMPKAGK